MRTVFERTWLATYPNRRHGITIGDVRDLFARLRRETERGTVRSATRTGMTVLVARLGDQVVGVCRTWTNVDHNQLQTMYVLPEHQRRGIGTRLWLAARHHLDDRKPTFVQVATYNLAAIRFYAALGFVDTGRRTSNARFNFRSGATIPEMEMRREAERV